MKLAGLSNCVVLLNRINNEQSIRELLHFLDTAKEVLKLVLLLEHLSLFLLRIDAKHSLAFHLFDVCKLLDRLLNRTEVGQCAAQPALVDIEGTGTKSFRKNRSLCLLLGTDEENLSTVLGQFLESVVCRVEHLLGLSEIDDVDAVLGSVDVRAELRVPLASLMSEMNTIL